MELWVVRHGETVANVNRIMQGHQGGELTDKGFAQAKTLGERLSNLKFDQIYVSDLNRTKQTADMILGYHGGTQVIYDKRIRERCGGILEGKPLNKFKEIATVKNFYKFLLE